MSQPMLTVSTDRATQRTAQLHLLPCRIHHDGDIDTTESYWDPAENQDNMKTAYFRGRKLHGKTISLPEGYYGSVVEKGETRREVPAQDELDDDVEVQEMPEAIEVAPLNGKAHFDDIVVWGHESTADASADPYVRSIEEWISFADQIHSYSLSETKSEK
ncbi:ribonuclease H2 non-catalytic subunit-domain-containing protein [Xylariales sp. AK1849]|nr:ribonuclease H2 non-catalytic subunit-domain-containing protein [Xylariales sp. AK1849]